MDEQKLTLKLMDIMAIANGGDSSAAYSVEACRIVDTIKPLIEAIEELPKGVKFSRDPYEAYMVGVDGNILWNISCKLKDLLR